MVQFITVMKIRYFTEGWDTATEDFRCQDLVVY